MQKVYVANWMALPKETKEHLIKVFNIVKTGNSEVRDQEVVTDGYTNDDLNAITLDKMAEYTGSPTTETFHRLWEITLAKVHYELHPPFDLNEGLTPTVTLNPEQPVVPPETKKFCEYCSALGPVKHMKDCTRPQ